LSLEETNLTTFPSAINRFTNLRSLYLGGNRMKNFPKNAFASLTSLENLDLSGSDLESAVESGALENLPPSFEQLKLNNGGLTRIPSQIFRNNVKIRHLSLFGNKITEIKRDDFKMARLNGDLNLGRNPIKKIEKGAFVGLGIGTLSLAWSEQLESFDLSVLNGLNGLDELSLYESSLLTSLIVTNVDEVPKQIHEITLTRCNLNYISPEVEKVLVRSGATHLYIDLNTNFTCDESVHWMAPHTFCLPSNHFSLIEMSRTTCNDGRILEAYLKDAVPVDCKNYPFASGISGRHQAMSKGDWKRQQIAPQTRNR